MLILFSSVLVLLLLPQFPSVFLLSSAYTLPDKYFINCGSESNASFGLRRVFVGDMKPSSLLINPGKSEVAKDNTISKSTPEIYHTARVYKRPTWYVFDNINKYGTYMVRLHFFPLSSETHPDLSKARFDIWASPMYPLLSNFSLQSSLEKVPIVKEFAFELQEGPFGIHFSPSAESPLAFVNAIEVFLVPERLKPAEAYPISPEVRTHDEDYSYELASEAFQTVYRINVGGSLVTPDNDTLWRTWLPDDGFLAIPAAARNSSYLGQGEIHYGYETGKYIAPSFVYNTAKELKIDTEGRSKFSNITWVFRVRKKTKHFLRLLWCDFQIRRHNDFLFDFFIDGNRTSFDSKEDGELKFAEPFWLDMVVVSDNSGFLHIGIARNDGKSKISRVFLSGIEIMELVEKSYLGPILKVPKNKQPLLLIGVLVGGVVLLALAVVGLLSYYFRARKCNNFRRLYQEFHSHDKQSDKISISDLAPDLNLELKIPFAEIQIATNDFDDDKVIGVGGFGKVYHATLRDKEVAVKRSRPGFGQGLHEFRTEIIILSQIRHRHLVSLYGYCDEKAEMILVYEFMKKGILREYLYGHSNEYSRPLLSWKRRLKICIDAAKGLDYLHTGSAGGVIIHRDVKTTNILLDKNYMAKVSDFGISKSGLPNPNEFDTTIRGTYGYLDPAYFNTGQLTEKSDVYSFGVVLIEVLSARSPIVKTLPEEEINLAEWAVLCKSRGEIEKLIDPFLAGTIEANSLRKFVEIAEKCLHESGAERPSMHDVVHALESALQFQRTSTDNAKAIDGGTIVDAECELPLQNLKRIPSIGKLDDSAIIDNDSETMHTREMVSQLKIDCAR